MKGLWLLTWRYLACHRWRTAILLLCLALTFLLPIYVRVLVDRYEADLNYRAQATPLVLGAKGNAIELVLRHLYFTRPDERGSWISQAEQHQAEQNAGDCLVLPLHVGYTAKQFPVVGTSLEYYGFRGLAVAAGSLPLRLGDCVLGAEAASTLGLRPGDTLLTDQTSLYNIAAEQPLKMRVTGILARANSPDDRAVFADVKTAWIIAGLGHGHDDLSDPAQQGKVMKKEADSTLVGNAAVVAFREVTEANLASFHVHGNPEHLPLSGLLIAPRTAKAATLFKGRYALAKETHVVVPTEVVAELLGMVFKIKRFFDANFALIALSTTLFLALIVLLTLRLRARERETLHRIGCARLTVFWLQALELVVLFAAGFALAVGLAYALFEFTRNWFLG